MSRTLALLLLSALLAPLPAQDARGRISGKVTDASGSAVPGAEVVALNTASNVRITAAANTAGEYELPFLQPGIYSIAVHSQGFKSYERPNVEVQVASRLLIDVALSVGQVSDSVTVSGEVPLLDAATANVGQITSQRQIVDLPLSGENTLYVAQLAPGVLYTGAANHPNFMAAVEVLSSIAVNGTRVGNTEFTIDGVPSMWGLNAAFAPPTETVAEVKVQTATYDANIARAPGGDVNIILKSGGNDLHASLQWTHTNQHLQALTLFGRQFLYNPSTGPLNDAKYQQANPLNILNHYGATVSGPVVIPKLYDGRNKTFWMVGFEGLSRPWEKLLAAITVPSDPQRGGDFSSLLKVGANYQIYDPATIASAPNGRFSRLPFANNIIPTSRLDNSATGLLQYWPHANTAGTADGLSNYTPLEAQVNNQATLSAKLDHNFSERHRIFTRYNYSYNLYTDNTLYGATVANTADRYRFNNGAVFDDIFVISPVLLNDFRLGFTRFEQSFAPKLQGFDLVGAGFSAKLASQVDPQALQLPTLSIASYSSMGGATNNDEPTNYYTLSNEVSWTKGAAVFRFGGEYRIYRHNLYTWGTENPSFTFNSKWTNGPLDSAAGSPIGQGLASFLLGLPSAGSLTRNSATSDNSYNYAFYVQSDWRATKQLTVNLGLRYDYDSPLTESYNRSVSNFAFSTPSPISQQVRANYAQNPISDIPASQFAVNGGLTYAGVNGAPRQLWSNSRNNFAPRIGLAWRVDPKTVIRTGYGIFYVPQGANVATSIQTGFSSATTLNPSLDNGLSFVANLANPYPTGLIPPLGAAGGLSTALGQSVSFFPAYQPSAYMQRWSFGVQRQLPMGFFIDVTYLGNRGTHLPVSRQFDALPGSYLSKSAVRDQTTINYLSQQVPNPFYPLLPGTNLASTTVARSQLLLPYPEFTGVSGSVPQGYSWYHAMQTMVERRFRNGFSAQFNWSYSKFMEATSYLNASDPVPSKVISDLDRTHQLHFSGIYELPFGKGKPWLGQTRGFVKAAATGWQVQAIWQYNTGPALGFGNALLVGSLQNIALPSDQRTIARWFNTAAFDTKSGDQLANNLVTLSTRFSGIRAPGVNMWNLSMRKTFALTERIQLQFHATALDALNHTTLSAPNTSPTSTLFGSINSASNSQPRVLEFGLKLRF